MYCNCTVKHCLLEVKIYVVNVYQEVHPPRKVFSFQEIIKHLDISKKINSFLLNLCKWKNTGFTFKLRGKLFSLVPNIMPTVLLIERNFFWTQIIPLTPIYKHYWLLPLKLNWLHFWQTQLLLFIAHNSLSNKAYLSKNNHIILFWGF